MTKIKSIILILTIFILLSTVCFVTLEIADIKDKSSKDSFNEEIVIDAEEIRTDLVFLYVAQAPGAGFNQYFIGSIPPVAYFNGYYYYRVIEAENDPYGGAYSYHVRRSVNSKNLHRLTVSSEPLYIPGTLGLHDYAEADLFCETTPEFYMNGYYYYRTCVGENRSNYEYVRYEEDFSNSTEEVMSVELGEPIYKFVILES